MDDFMIDDLPAGPPTPEERAAMFAWYTANAWRFRPLFPPVDFATDPALPPGVIAIDGAHFPLVEFPTEQVNSQKM